MRLLSIFLLISFIANSQSKIDSLNTNKYNYLEDQLYVGITYNLLNNKPKGIDLRGFSNSMSIGYLRDFPFDKKSNVGIAIGFGYTKTTYFHNMKIIEVDNTTYFSDFADIDDYSSNKLVYHSIDLPFEFRIRKSTYEANKFWRFYFGWKLSYVFHHKSQFDLNITDTHKYTSFDNFKKLQYGVSATIGHGTWNGYFYYGLTNVFEYAKFNETDALNMKSVRFGLMFYVL